MQDRRFQPRQLDAQGGRYEKIGDAFKDSTVTVPVGADDVPGLIRKLPKEGKPPAK